MLLCVTWLVVLLSAAQVGHRQDQHTKERASSQLRIKSDQQKPEKEGNFFFVVTRTMRTVTSTLVVTSTTSVTGFCAKPVNVTGSCRRRRGSWLEDPIVLTFDDVLDDDLIGDAFSPTKTFRYRNF